MKIKKENTKLVIVVQDRGRGIPKGKLTNIFRQFTQVDTSLQRESEGSGMGLALVKRLIELQGGTIKAQSVWQEGTKITVSLPSTKLKTDEQRGKRMVKSQMEFSDIYTIWGMQNRNSVKKKMRDISSLWGSISMF